MPPKPEIVFGLQNHDAALEVVLRTLKEAGAPVSGEALAVQLGLSRAAVWKRINRLKARGYEISGSPRRGYQLLACPDLLLPAEITQDLQARYLRGPIYHFPTLSSTNDLAKDLGRREAPEGTLVVAEAQSAGRGRLGRGWESPPGVGLYVSLLLRPRLPPTELPQITLTAAVSVARVLRRVAGLTPGIKWPNDLLLNGKKVGGILTEMETEMDLISHLVVGLGLNVNNPGFPPPLAETATSLALTAGRPFSRLKLLQAWLEEFEELYGRFLARGFPGILEEWKRYTVTLGREVRVRQGLGEVQGKALEVAPDGALLVQTRTGEIVRVTSGELASGPGEGPEAPGLS